MPAPDWALFFYFAPSSPDNSTRLDSRAKRARDEIVRLAGHHPQELRIAYRLALSGLDPGVRVVLHPAGTIQQDEDVVYDPGDPEPFKKFFRWAHNHGCRGKRCAVFLWGHGFGPAGLFGMEDLIDLGITRLAAPISLPIGQGGIGAKALRGSFAELSGVKADLKRGTVRRTDGLTIKFPHGALIERAGAVFAQVKPEVPIGRQRRIAGGVPLALMPAVIRSVKDVDTTTVNLKFGLAGLRELRRKPTDVLLFQSCWMSGLEVARQLRGEVKTMIGSQTLMPIQPDPWPYAQLLAALRTSRGSSHRETRLLVEKLVTILSRWHTIQRQKRPITGLNLEDNTLPEAFKRLVQALRPDAQAKPLKLEHLYSNAKTRDRSQGRYKKENSGVIDVLRLCDELAAPTRSAQVKGAAKQLANILREKVIVAHRTPDRDLYRGVTVFYRPSPETETELERVAHIEFLQKPEYEFFSFARTNWTHFAFELQP